MIGIESSNDTTKDLRQGPSTIRKGCQVIIKVVTIGTGIKQLFCCLGTVLVNFAIVWKQEQEYQVKSKRPRHVNNRGESGYSPTHTYNNNKSTPPLQLQQDPRLVLQRTRHTYKHVKRITITHHGLTVIRGSLVPRHEGQTSSPDLAIVPIRDGLLRVKEQHQQQQTLPFSCR